MVYNLQSIKTLIFLIDWSPNKGSFLFINFYISKGGKSNGRKENKWKV